MNAFLDTTVLADATLKSYDVKKRMLSVLSTYENRELPVYAVKEFRAGPLQNYVWFHNVVSSERSYVGALRRIHRVSRTQQRYLTSTAIEALISFESRRDASSKISPSDRARQMRIHLKRVIVSAWPRREGIATQVTFPLACYDPGPVIENPDGSIKLEGRRCSMTVGCQLVGHLNSARQDLAKIIPFLETRTSPRERRQAGALKKVLDHEQITETDCRNFGDPVFSVLAPSGFVVLSSNLKDHAPLALALGKRAVSPYEE